MPDEQSSFWFPFTVGAVLTAVIVAVVLVPVAIVLWRTYEAYPK